MPDIYENQKNHAESIVSGRIIIIIYISNGQIIIHFIEIVVDDFYEVDYDLVNCRQRMKLRGSSFALTER